LSSEDSAAITGKDPAQTQSKVSTTMFRFIPMPFCSVV
jgi:hypothetical protein